jgi:hypothetical protein
VPGSLWLLIWALYGIVKGQAGAPPSPGPPSAGPPSSPGGPVPTIAPIAAPTFSPTRTPTILAGSPTPSPTTSPPSATPTAYPTYSDYTTLMALYYATGGAKWAVKTNWGTSNGLSTWYGIEANSLGEVTSIGLDSNYLNGTIPDSLYLLEKLQYLDLGKNGLQGTIPSTLGLLTNLESLILWQNSLSGTIATELANIVNISAINLRYNSLTGTIPNVLAGLVNLTRLELDYNMLSGTISSVFCDTPSLFMMFADNNTYITCYEPCVPQIGVFDYLTSYDYPVCVDDIVIGLCGFANDVGLANKVPDTTTLTETIAYAQRIVPGSSFSDIYSRYEESIVKYTVTFDRSILLGSLVTLDYSINYRYDITISTSHDGYTYADYSYSDFIFPGVDSTPAFTSTDTYIRVEVNIHGLDSAQKTIPGYSYNVEITKSTYTWDCDNVNTSSISERRLTSLDSVATVIQPCLWYGEYQLFCHASALLCFYLSLWVFW